MHIAIFRRDIEIAADDYVSKNFLRLGNAIAQADKPLQFVIERRRTDSLAVWRINGEDAHVINRCRNHAGLRIIAFSAQRRLAVA